MANAVSIQHHNGALLIVDTMTGSTLGEVLYRNDDFGSSGEVKGHILLVGPDVFRDKGQVKKIETEWKAFKKTVQALDGIPFKTVSR